MFCCSCPGEMFHRATRSEQLATICAQKSQVNYPVDRMYKEIRNYALEKNWLRVAGRALHCATAVASCYDWSEKYNCILRRATLHATKKDALQVAELPWYTVQFLSNFALQVAGKTARHSKTLGITFIRQMKKTQRDVKTAACLTMAWARFPVLSRLHRHLTVKVTPKRQHVALEGQLYSSSMRRCIASSSQCF